MKRLVDVDWLDDWLREAEEAATRQRKYVLASALNTIRGNLKHVPTVEIIRCNECKWWDEFPSSSSAPEYHECKASGFCHLHTKALEYCSKAVKKVINNE